MSPSNVGLIGLATMGANLARNIERNGYAISIFNRSNERMEEFMQQFGKDKNFTECKSIEELVTSLETPRKIILLVKAGKPVDLTIEALLPHLEKDDIIIDGGNSFYQDTIRRTEELNKKGIRFMGVGVSGGEEGALNGPSIMPGGTIDAWEQVKDMLQKISAKAEDGEPCCDYVGPDGAGHFVKMVHNGIEYGDMQLISEVYSIMKNGLEMDNEAIANTFKNWNTGKLSSYLIEITSTVLRKKDDKKDGYLIDSIMDKSGQKGTGKWTSINALELSIPLPTITAAVYERFISSFKEERKEAAKIYTNDVDAGRDLHLQINDLENALYTAKICAYTQGMFLIKKASEEYGWNIKLSETAKLWRAGCIIRAKILGNITDAYKSNKDLNNLLLDSFFEKEMKENVTSLRTVVAETVKAGIPCPALSVSLAYFDSYTSETLPANMIQALRDLFGAHTYERIDMEGSFHTEWNK